MKKLSFHFEEKVCVMTVSANVITLSFLGQKFTAKYNFLDSESSLADVDDDLFTLMIYVLFYGLEEVTLPKPRRIIQDFGPPIISYSGGSDSTALLYATGGQPVHITRSFDKEYDNRQIKAVLSVGAPQVHTDFELIRTLYGKTKGFNVGMGYACMFIPLLPLFLTNTIALGWVFDDIGFEYGKVFKHNVTPGEGLLKSRSAKIISALGIYGINITGPLAGYSEVLTTRIAASSGISLYSSCHTVGNDSACRKCYKCFRKQAILRDPLNWSDLSVRNYIMRFLQKAPLKMACSTIYAIQYAGYSFPEFKRYVDIDVSFCERVNPVLFDDLNGVLLPGIELQTMEDFRAIEKFVERINDPKLYEF
jgi:hypothetical protein